MSSQVFTSFKVTGMPAATKMPGAKALLQYACKLNLYRTPSGRGVQRHLEEVMQCLLRDYDEARRAAKLPSLRPVDEAIE